MAHWIVAYVPAWVAGVVLVLVLPLVSAGAQAILRRVFPALRKGEHNDVAGFLVAVIGVSYAVVVGFAVVVLWQNFTTEQDATKTEALQATGIEQGSQIFGATTQRRLRGQVIAYNQTIVDNWGSIKQGNASPQVRARLDDMFTTIQSLEPRTAAQRAFVDQAEAHLFELSDDRRQRVLQIDEGALPSLMWVAILIASGVTITFCLLFGLENARMHYVMVAGVTAIIGTNLFLVTELNYPFVGDLSVQPTSYVTVVDSLTHGR